MVATGGVRIYAMWIEKIERSIMSWEHVAYISINVTGTLSMTFRFPQLRGFLSRRINSQVMAKVFDLRPELKLRPINCSHVEAAR